MIDQKLRGPDRPAVPEKGQIGLKRFGHAAFVKLHGEFVAAHGKGQRQRRISAAQGNRLRRFPFRNVDVSLNAEDRPKDRACDQNQNAHVNDVDAEKSKASLLGAKPDTVRSIRPFHGAVFTLQEGQSSVRRRPNVRPCRKRIFFRHIPEDVFVEGIMLHPETPPGQGKAIQRTNDEVDGQKSR